MAERTRKYNQTQYLTDNGTFLTTFVRRAKIHRKKRMNTKKKKRKRKWKGLRSPALSLFNFAFHLTFCQRKIKIHCSSRTVVGRQHPLRSRVRASFRQRSETFAINLSEKTRCITSSFSPFDLYLACPHHYTSISSPCISVFVANVCVCNVYASWTT